VAPPYSAYKFNAVDAWWAAWNLTATWDAETGLKDLARNAINSWKDPITNPNAVPQLRFQEGGDQFPLRLWIHDGTCPLPQFIACVPKTVGEIVFAIVAEDPPGSGNVPPGALYWYTSHIHVDLSKPGWTDLGKTDAITHEVGHWIGLHEQYQGVACNLDDANGGLSVMNLGSTTTGNCRGVHMPSAWDKTTVTKFWTGDAVQGAVLTGSSSVLTLTWTNRMWGGGPHGGNLYRWVCNPNCSWQLVIPFWQTWEKVGFHHDAFDIGSLRMTWNQPCGFWYGANVSEYSFLFSQWAPPQWAQTQVALSC
jgi:hypothetical protein